MENSPLGDNMLTALSVARECGMVSEHQKIILVQAFPGGSGKSEPTLEYMYTEDPQDRLQKSEVNSLSLSLSLSHTHTHTHTHTLSLDLSLSLTHTHTLCLSLMDT